MACDHHGMTPEQPSPAQTELMKRFIEQAQGKAKRAYSQGRISPDDDGDLTMAITADTQNKTVIVRFGKPTEWIGMNARQAVEMAQTLIKHARAVTDEPLVVSM